MDLAALARMLSSPSSPSSIATAKIAIASGGDAHSNPRAPCMRTRRRACAQPGARSTFHRAWTPRPGRHSFHHSTGWLYLRWVDRNDIGVCRGHRTLPVSQILTCDITSYQGLAAGSFCEVASFRNRPDRHWHDVLEMSLHPRFFLRKYHRHNYCQIHGHPTSPARGKRHASYSGVDQACIESVGSDNHQGY